MYLINRTRCLHGLSGPDQGAAFLCQIVDLLNLILNRMIQNGYAHCQCLYGMVKPLTLNPQLNAKEAVANGIR
ncbi:hypothetical protein D3C73_1292960 [compost metagenome]